MVHWSLDPENPTKSCMSRPPNLCVHLTHKTPPASKDMHIQKATRCLKDVTLQKQSVSFCHYNGGTGRCAQAKQLDAGLVAQRVLAFCCIHLKMQRGALSFGVQT